MNPVALDGPRELGTNGTPARNGNGRPAARRPLRVGMIHFSEFEIDGRLQRQAHALAERGDEVESVCLSRASELRVGTGRIRLHEVRARQLRGGAGSYLYEYARFFGAAYRRLSAIDRLWPLDVVEVHNMPNFLAFAALRPKLRGTPVILNVHDTFAELFATKFGVPMDHRMVRMIEQEERWSSSFADVMVTVTHEARRRLNGRGVGNGRTHVVMNSPDERFFGDPRPPVQIPREGPVDVVYHGGTAERFGVESLVRAVALLGDRVPELRLKVYGSFRGDHRIRALARELAPDRVWVAPEPVPVEHIAEHVSRCHIGVVPTLGDVFTELLLPVKLLEYVHLGIPAVVARLPATEQYFDDSEVRYYEPGSVAGLAEAIAEVRADPDAARERAARAALRLAEFDWKRQREGYLSMIDALVGPRNAVH
jgi:glycosyltransferase involved in cell wall biosynthesis